MKKLRILIVILAVITFTACDNINLNQEPGSSSGVSRKVTAEYNAAMVKFNYAFCNVGTLPQGATTPLAREYKTYLTE